MLREITLKAVRRLLEDDLSLPPKTLDEPGLKASISSQVDEARFPLRLARPVLAPCRAAF